MATADECVKIQKQDGILHTPTDAAASTHSSNTSAESTPSTVKINLVNNTTSDKVYANVSGLNNNAVWLLQSDGSSDYFPANPPANGTALAVDVSIELGGPGSTRTITVPQLVGARIWLAQDTPLIFALNQGTSGPALVEPSVMNTSDANYATRWDFCEFTFNSYELFVNVTYVDFVSIPIALQLTTTDGSSTQTVAGLPADGIDTVCKALQAQQVADCAGWDKLVVQVTTESGGTEFLRALSPNAGINVNGSDLFSGYYDSYVDAVWDMYSTSTLNVNTQYSWGELTGQVDSDGALTFAGVVKFTKPSAADIFNCSSGPFSITDGEAGNIGARIVAAFNRSTMLLNSNQPDGVGVADFYKTSPTNHYARILHEQNLDGRGYTFPYDDVLPSGASDIAGTVSSGSPGELTVYVGGNASASSTKTRSTPIRLREMARPGRQLVGGRGHYRRSLPAEIPAGMSEKEALAVNEKARMLVQEVMAPFYEVEQGEEAAKKSNSQRDPEKMALGTADLEMGTGAMLPPYSTSRHGRARAVLLVHQALQFLWGMLATLSRSAWALVPRAVATPVGKACTAVVAAPAVKAVVSGAASLATSAYVRPVVMRAVVAGVLVLVYIAAGMSPLIATFIASLAGTHGEAAATSPSIIEVSAVPPPAAQAVPAIQVQPF